jgi:aminopeptidase-like protein
MKTTFSHGNSCATDLIAQIDAYLKRLFPITRSITGNGNRETLRILQEIVPLQIKEYPSGTKAYDWVIPKEWNIRDAWIKDPQGKKIVDFKRSNLHVVSYSVPVHKKISLEELKEHLHYLEKQPDAIPYRTSYYKETWGFCLSYADYQKYFNQDGQYEVCIDSELKDGSLTIGELIIKGKSSKEFLISTYICHPSLANDNLSGMLLTALIGKKLLEQELNYTYRILFVPENIGAIVYLSKNENAMKRVFGGFVVTTVAGPGKYGYKSTYLGNHWIDRIVEKSFNDMGCEYQIYPFDIHGSDECRYSFPFFRIPVGTICKDKYYEYDYYHTSLDDLDFVQPENVLRSFDVYMRVLNSVDINVTYESLHPHCEPQLGKRGLYPLCGGHIRQKAALAKNALPQGFSNLDLILWLLFYCDGEKNLFEIAEKTALPLLELYRTAEELCKHTLLKKSID